MSGRSPQIRNRASGWTVERQTLFLDALVELGSVIPAAARVGLCASSAHRLRRQPRGADFAQQWDAVVTTRRAMLHDELMTRALAKPVMVRYRGRIVGDRVEANTRLLLSVLKRTAAPPTAYDEDRVMARFDEVCAALEAV